MPKKTEIEMLIARYRNDIAALEEREQDLMRQTEVLKDFIPNVKQHEIDADARKKFDHLKSVLKDLQQVIGLVREEKETMKNRVEELQLLSANQPERSDKILENNYPVLKLEKPGKVDAKYGKKTDLETEGSVDQRLTPGELKEVKGGDTDWKEVCKDLQKQLFDLNANLKNSSQKLMETKGQVKTLEEKYSNLKKEFHSQIEILEKKTGPLPPAVFDKEQKNYLQEEHENKDTSTTQNNLSQIKPTMEPVTRLASFPQPDTYSKKIIDTSKSEPNPDKPGEVDGNDEKELGDLQTKAVKDKLAKFDELLQSENTDWKNVYEDLQKQKNKLTENLNNSSQKLAKSKNHVKDLEEKYSNLKKELQVKIQLLEKKPDSLTSEVTDKEKGKNLQIEDKSKITSEIHESPSAYKLPVSKEKETRLGLEPPPESHSEPEPKPEKPALLDAKPEKQTNLQNKKMEDQKGTSEAGSQPENTEWKTISEDLQKQVTNLTENLNSFSQKLKNSESYIKNLEEENSNLKKELQTKIQPLEKKPDSLTSEVINKEQGKNLQMDQKGEDIGSATQNIPSEIKSSKEPETRIDMSKPEAKPGVLDEKREKGPININERFENKQVTPESGLQPGITDWKKTSEDLRKKVNELTENLNRSSKKLKESESRIKHLEEYNSKLKKDLQEKIQLVEKRTNSLVSGVVSKQQDKNLQEEGERTASAIEEPPSGDMAKKDTQTKSTTNKTRTGMDTAEFRQRGKEMVDYMCQYMETLPQRPVVSMVDPGYLKGLVPSEAPMDPEPWDDIMADVESKIMPGITHWQHPRFHAYFPSGNSYPSILGDMLSDIIACVGFSWPASPACTELETIVLDWMAQAMGLPGTFLSDSKGGGVIQGSASECVLVCMLAARAEALRRLNKAETATSPNDELHLEAVHLPRLVAYCSKEAHSCVEKAAIISLVQLRILEPDDDNSLRGEILRKAIEEDKAKGLVPFFVSAIIGSTGSCSFDNLQELGPVAQEHGVWLHVDAAYAGCAMVCPELRYLMQGVEYADSFNTNPNKFFLTNFDCSLLWVKERTQLIKALTVDPLYLKHEHEEEVFDYRHWGISLSRRFRSLKLWFVLRSFGISGLQQYIRNHIQLARKFEDHLLKDKRFEVLNDVRLGLVCFRLRSKGDLLTTELLANINHSRKLHMIPARIKGVYIIRFCVVAQHACEADIDYAWSVISDFATELLSSSEQSPRILCGIPTTPEGRKLCRQFSFTRGVSQSAFTISTSLRSRSLYDGATPIIMVDDEGDTNVFDEVFESARNQVQDQNDKTEQNQSTRSSEK